MELENTQPANVVTRTKDYVEDVKAEMRRVTWPAWPQVRSTTLVVILATFLLAAYFFVVDAVVNSAVTKIIDHFTK